MNAFLFFSFSPSQEIHMFVSSSSATAPRLPGLTISLPAFFSSFSESNFPTVSPSLRLLPAHFVFSPWWVPCRCWLWKNAPQTSSLNPRLHYFTTKRGAIKTCTRSLFRPLVLFWVKAIGRGCSGADPWCHTGTLSHLSHPHSPQSVTSSVYIRGLVIVGRIFCDFWCWHL